MGGMNNNMLKTNCPKCNNTIGFAFGVCIDCGWNHISNEWSHIKVNPQMIPPQFRQSLIDYYAKQFQ